MRQLGDAVELAITPGFAAQDPQRALDGYLPTMEQTVEHIRRLHKNALPVARALARGEPPPRRLSPAIRDRVLKLLLRAGVVEHFSRDDWRLVDPLLEVYLRRLDPLAWRAHVVHRTCVIRPLDLCNP